MRAGGLWRDPEFLKLWTGQAISQIGSRISREGLPLTAVLVLGASPFQMGLLNGLGAAAVLAPGLFAGAWVDRLRRRPVLIAADLGRALLLGSVPIAAAMHRLSIGQLYAVAAGAAALSLLFDIAYQAYLPALVTRDHLVEGNSKLALTESIAEVAGPGMTGVLVQLLTAPIAILFDAISFLCSAVSITWIRTPEPRPSRRSNRHIGREILEGLEVSWRNPLLRALAARTGTLAFFAGFPTGLYVLFAVRELHLNPATLGFVIAAGGVSSLAGTLLAAPLAARFGFARTFLGAAILTGISGLIVPMARGPVWMAAGFLVAAQLGDAGWPIYHIQEISLRQAVTPDRLLGRVNSAMQLLFRGMLPLGALAGGAVAEWAGIRNSLYVGTSGCLLSSLWLIFSPIRRLKTIPETGREATIA